MIVMYNLVIGVLLMFASSSMAAVAGKANAAHQPAIVKYTRLSIFTMGAVWASLSGFIYIVFHVLRIGVDN